MRKLIHSLDPGRTRRNGHRIVCALRLQRRGESDAANDNFFKVSVGLK